MCGRVTFIEMTLAGAKLRGQIPSNKYSTPWPWSTVSKRNYLVTVVGTLVNYSCPFSRDISANAIVVR